MGRMGFSPEEIHSHKGFEPTTSGYFATFEVVPKPESYQARLPVPKGA